MPPVQHHLAAWDVHAGKAFSPKELAAACSVPALQPNFLSARRAGPEERSSGSPAPLTGMQGMEGWVRLLPGRGNALLHRYLWKGTHFNAVTPTLLGDLDEIPCPWLATRPPWRFKPSPISPWRVGVCVL